MAQHLAAYPADFTGELDVLNGGPIIGGCTRLLPTDVLA